MAGHNVREDDILLLRLVKNEIYNVSYEKKV
jgi:hypothetical protein